VYTYPSVPTPLPAAPVPLQNQNEGKNELNERQNQNTAPPDTAAVAISDTREELESGVLSVIFRFAFLYVLPFGGGWKETLGSPLGFTPRQGWGGSYSHRMRCESDAGATVDVGVGIGGGQPGRVARLDGVRDAVPSTCNSTVTAIRY
jgi:hypothetical protein